MSFGIASGARDQGVIAGNVYDKYGSTNVIVRSIMRGFESALADLVSKAAPKTIHEVGCGEGYWVLRWAAQGITARGCDLSRQVIELARANAVHGGKSPDVFVARSIYDLEAGRDSADLVVCCEVLEHLDMPESGLEALRRVVDRHLLISVPREPIWRALNLARGKYVLDWGNTPGHIQHWTRAGFIRLVSQYFYVVETRTPLPWTMLLCQPRR